MFLQIKEGARAAQANHSLTPSLKLAADGWRADEIDTNHTGLSSRDSSRKRLDKTKNQKKKFSPQPNFLAI
jgi:hypothetical protein